MFGDFEGGVSSAFYWDLPPIIDKHQQLIIKDNKPDVGTNLVSDIYIRRYWELLLPLQKRE